VHHIVIGNCIYEINDAQLGIMTEVVRTKMGLERYQEQKDLLEKWSIKPCDTLRSFGYSHPIEPVRVVK
jgi:hypothetical protein